MNQEIRALLVVLGLKSDIECIPLMKEVRRQFLKLSIEKHPDKPGGTKEAFQELKDAYDRVGKIIHETEQDDLNDGEEAVARKLFRETNLEKINLYSVTISILTSQSDAWENVLTAKYGEHAESKDKCNGKKFLIQDYEAENEQPSSVYLTLWKKEKFNRSTILIDAKRKQNISIDYVQKELPNIYEMVSKLSPAPLLVTLGADKKKKTAPKTGLKAHKRSSSSDPVVQNSRAKEMSCKDCAHKFVNTIE